MALLASLWAAQGRRVHAAIKGGKIVHFAPRSGACEALDAAGWDVYFAPARYKDGSTTRTAADVASCGAFWADLDCGPGKPYPDSAAALRALLAWQKAASFPPFSHVVGSGSGLHVYWQLTAECPAVLWQQSARALKARWAADGLHADPARTADIASILRVPGTRNHKTTPPAPVRELHSGAPTTLLAIVQALVAGGVRAAAPRDYSDPLDRPNLPPGDAQLIVSKCGQMAGLRDNPAAPEPLWRAGLSVLARCTGGDKLTHDWSRGDPRYSHTETTRKAARTGGPATCATFAAHNPRGCEGCPSAGKVTSPIMLGVEQLSAPAAPWGESRRGVFSVGANGVWLNPPEGEATLVSELPIWLEDVEMDADESRQDMRACVVVRYRDCHNKLRGARLPQTVRASAQELARWLGAVNLIDFVPNVKGFNMYLTQLSKELQRKRETTRYYSRAGWHDTGFVLGAVQYTPGGAVPCISRNTHAAANELKPRGSLDAWKATVNGLKLHDWRTKIALLAGFGSAILPEVNRDGAVLSLTGESGAGKTTAAELALSIYGDPKHMRQQGSVTATALNDSLRGLCNVPYLFDEASTLNGKQLEAFIYTVANGSGGGKGRSTKTLTVEAPGKWQLQAFITSNRALLDFDDKDFNEAVRRRIIEINFGRALPLSEGADLNAGITANAGTAAPVYLEWLARNRPQIQPLFDRCLSVIEGLGGIAAANRFGIWTLAAALAGGIIASRLGLVAWDVLEPVRKVAQTLSNQAAGTLVASERVKEVLSEFVATRSNSIVRWNRGSKFASHSDGEQIREPVGRIVEDGVYLMLSSLRQELKSRGLNYSALVAWCASVGVRHERSYVPLMPRTPQVSCLYLPALALPLDSAEE